MRRLIALTLSALLVAVGLVLPCAGVVSGDTAAWYEQYTTSNSAGAYVYGPNFSYQTFNPVTSHYFNLVSFSLSKVGAPNYTVTISLYNADPNHKPTGSALCSTTFQASSLTTAQWYEYQFTTGANVLAGTEYVIVLSGNGGSSTTKVAMRLNTTSGYSRGMRGGSADGGTTWVTLPANDIAFKEGGKPVYATVTMTAPSAISFNTFHMGWNLAGSTTPGKVTVVPGISGLTTWTVTAQVSSPYLGNASDNLTNPLLIGPNDSLEPWTDWRVANGGADTIDGHSFDDGALTYSGTTTPGGIPFYAAQFIESSDLKQGTYTTVITFTATCQP